MPPLLRSILIIGLVSLPSCASTQGMWKRATGAEIEKHGKPGTVRGEPSPAHFALLPVGIVLDIITSPLRIAEWIEGDD